MSARSPSLTALGAFLAIAAAGALAALAGSRAGDAVSPAKPASPAGRIVSVGPARLVVPADWRAVSPSSARVAGLEAGRATVFQPASRPWMRVVATFDPTVAPSLIPEELRSVAVLVGRSPRPTRVSGWPAWTYDADPAGAARRGGSVTALATTAGVLAVACTTVVRWQSDLDCASDVGSVMVPGASALVPSRSLALEVHLPVVIDQLNRRRTRHRGRLNAARTYESQALAARRLDADHRLAARSLRRLGGSAAAPLIRDLTNVADEYGALARAADEASPGEFASAATGIRHAEAALTGAVAAVSRPQTAEVAAHVATLGQDRAGSAPGGVPALLFVLLTAVAMIAGAATGNSDAASGFWRSRFPRRGDASSRARPGSNDRHATARSSEPPQRSSPAIGLPEHDVRPSLQLPLVKIGEGVRTHVWSGDRPACRRSGYDSREARTPSTVTHVGTGEPTCSRCLATVIAAP
jgi:hypothetical protein